MAIYQLGDVAPEIHPEAYVAPEAVVIGKVRIGRHASVWPGAVLRGDTEPIEIGERSNIQDGAVLHTDPGCPLVVGPDVTVGHQAMLHGCTIGSGSLIGLQAVVLTRSVIGEGCLVAAGALVTEGKSFEAGWMVLGRPAKATRALTEDESAAIRTGTQVYVERAQHYRAALRRIG